MALSAGSRLGPYEIVALLGAGGMGEVYRARDTKLGREVAIKVLPAAVAQDAERLARFKREAQLLAALNHPNIAAIYGLEDVPSTPSTPSTGSGRAGAGLGVVCLVLELVEGEDLAERLKRGALPLDEALAIAKQIAEALEEAHEKGIVHRDLKPANVKLTPDGKVKVLDFGLAKAYASDAAHGGSFDSAHSPTMTHAATMAGMILGTVAYMSPEQARGKNVDKRADIWAFGVVLYEMLAGQQLFHGETVSDTLAGVLKGDIGFDRLPGATPPAARRLLRRCLERDPKQRLRDIGDARCAIDEILAGARGQTEGTSTEAGPRKSARLPWILAVVFGLALAATLARGLFRSQPPPAATTRLNIELSPKEPLSSLFGANGVLSPDGRTIALVTGPEGSTHIQTRRLDELDAAVLAGTEGTRSPFFSPDGRWIGFASPAGLMKIGVAGGAPVKVADLGANLGRGATWGNSDVIVFAAGWDTGLSRVSAAGGASEPLTTLDASRDERSHRWPSFLPGGNAVVFMVQRSGQDYDDADIEAVSLADGRRTVLVKGGAFPRYAPSGRLLFVRGGVLYALRFDPGSLTVEEPPTPVLEGLLVWTGDQESGDGSAEYALSETGDLLYRPSGKSTEEANTNFVWVDSAGRETAAFSQEGRVLSFDLSPDGRRVALAGRVTRGQGVFIRDLERGSVLPLSSEGAGEGTPVWSPDGRRLAYGTRGADKERIVKIWTLDGSVAESTIPSPPRTGGPTSWASDGRAVVANVFMRETGSDIVLLPVDGRESSTVVASPTYDGGGQVSPNGRWVAYYSDEKGIGQIFVTSLHGSGRRWQVSARRGSQPRWSHDGRFLYFVLAGTNFDQAQESELVALPVEDTGAEPRFGEPRIVYRGFMGSAPDAPCYDLHSDGRLLILKRKSQDTGLDRSHAILVLGWREELTRRMAATR